MFFAAAKTTVSPEGILTVRLVPEKIAGPFVVLVDQREKAPYRFEGIVSDARHRRRPVVVTRKWAHLPTGDYSIDGMEDRVAIERKSLADLYSTLGQHRARFQAEHERMAAMPFAAVVIESDLARAIVYPPPRSKLSPKSVYRTYLKWQIRYRVPWLWIGSREGAEKTTYQLLRMYWESIVLKEDLKNHPAQRGAELCSTERSDDDRGVL